MKTYMVCYTDFLGVTGAAGFVGVEISGTILESGGDVVCLDVIDAPPVDSWGKFYKPAEKAELI